MSLLPKIRRIINPPYSGENLLAIFGVLTILVAIPFTVSLSFRQPSTQLETAAAENNLFYFSVFNDKNGDGNTSNDEVFNSGGNPAFSSSIGTLEAMPSVPIPLDATGYGGPVGTGPSITSATGKLTLNSPWVGTSFRSVKDGSWIVQPYTSPPYSFTYQTPTGAYNVFLGIQALPTPPPPPPPPPCTDECSSGAKKCAGSTSYQTCGNFDADTCLEWSSATACSAGKTCSGAGICSFSPKPPPPTSYLENLQLEISVPYLNGSLKAKVEVGGVSKEIELSGVNKSYTLDLKGSNLSLNKEYNLAVTSDKTLVRKVKFTPTSNSTNLKVADLLLGDLNQDNTVDSTDQLKLVDSIASQTLTGDVNTDETTNSFDWAILLANFGKKGN